MARQRQLRYLLEDEFYTFQRDLGYIRNVENVFLEHTTNPFPVPPKGMLLPDTHPRI
jgi:hypothetical protein